MQTEEERAGAKSQATPNPGTEEFEGLDGADEGPLQSDSANGQSGEVAQALKAKQSTAVQSVGPQSLPTGAQATAPTGGGGPDTGPAKKPKKPAGPKKAPAANPAQSIPGQTPASAETTAATPPGGTPPAGPNGAGQTPNPTASLTTSTEAGPPNLQNPATTAKPGDPPVKGPDTDAKTPDGEKRAPDGAAKADEAGKDECLPEDAPTDTPPDGTENAAGAQSKETPTAAKDAGQSMAPKADGQETPMTPAGPAPAPVASAPIDWDTEVAWHDYFQQFKGGAGPGGGPAPAAGAGGGGGGAAPAQLDRGQMVKDALLKGGKEGLKEGAAQFLLETVINVATSKIPMGASVLESGRMIATLVQSGPRGWLEANVTGEKAIGGKWSSAYQKFKSGGIVDKIEGVVNLLEGASSFIGTLTSILWIVAGAGFLISLFCPALLPFVVMAAQWATTLTKISTVIDVFTTLLRLVVMAGRSLEILYSDASPDELLAKQKSLESQTKDFTKESSNRALKSGREHLQNKAKTVRAERAAAKSGAAPAPTPAAAPKEKPALSSRILTVLGAAAGDFRPADNKGRSGLGRDVAEGKAEIDRTGKVTSAAFGPGDTAHKINEMEKAEAVVFVSQKHEDVVDEKLRNAGQRGTIRSEEKRANEALKARVDSAREAEEKANGEREKLKTATDQRQAAEEKAAAARAAQKPGITEAEAVANQRKAVLVETESELSRLKNQLNYEHEILAQAKYCQEHDRQGAKSGQYDDIVKSTQANVDALHTQIGVTEKRVVTVRTEVSEAEANLAQRKAALQSVEQDAATAGQAERQAADRVSTAAAQQNDAKQQADDHKTSHDARDGESFKHADASWKRQEKQAKDFSAALAWDGKGPTRLHGPNSTASKAGRDILDVEHKVGKKTAVGALESVVDGVEGIGHALSGKDKPADAGASPAAGPQTQASPIAAQVRARLAKLAQELPAPPTQAHDDAAAAKSQLSALDQEEEDLRTKRLTVGALRTQGKTESGALTTLRAGAKAGQAAAASQVGAAQALVGRQDKAGQKVGEMGGKGGEAGSKGGEAQGLLSPIVGGMLKLMGMIPSKISSKGAQGTAATQKLAGGLKDQGTATGGAAAANKQASTDMGQMKSETSGAAGQAQTLGQELAASEQALGSKQAETEQVVGELGAAGQAGDERLKAITAQRQQLAAQQTGALARANEWVQTHGGLRQKGMAEVEALASSGGGAGGAGAAGGAAP